MEKFKDIDLYIEKYGQKIIDFLPGLIGAILLLIVGLWVIKFINRVVSKFFKKKDYDPTLEKFIQSLINWGLKIVLFVLVDNLEDGVCDVSHVHWLDKSRLAAVDQRDEGHGASGEGEPAKQPILWTKELGASDNDGEWEGL